MYHNHEIPEQVQLWWQTCQALVPQLLENCPVRNHDLKFIASQMIDPRAGSIYLLKSGTVSETYAGQIIVNYEEGDLLGVDGLYQAKVTSYQHDFAVIVDEYDGQQFIETITQSAEKSLLLNQYLSCLLQSYQLLMCHFSQQESTISPEFRVYKQGEVIIEENTEGDEVFTLLSGSAKVMVNDTQVGEVRTDEIFGVIAALTNTKRTASVIATADCETIVIKSENFRDLLRSRPDTVQKLIHDMARTIVSSNRKVIELSINK